MRGFFGLPLSSLSEVAAGSCFDQPFDSQPIDAVVPRPCEFEVGRGNSLRLVNIALANPE
jgi:hypothetical protein